MLAASLVALRGINANNAIREIRKMRPFSIETYEQENAVREFAESLTRETATENASKQCD